MTTVGEVMTKRVNTVRPTNTIGETIAFLTQHHIGGAPVVDDWGILVGMISELVLIDVAFDAEVKDAPVSKYMTSDVYTLGPEAPLSNAARLFALFKFRRIPVVEDGKLVGILSRRDLMNHVVRTGALLVDPLMELMPSLATVDYSDESYVEDSEYLDLCAAEIS
jgi:CBS domain-containing protein